MKNVIITIGILLSTLSNSVYAQTKIGSKFNEKFADSLLFEMINQKRVSLGLTPYYKSKTVSKYISKRNANIMVSMKTMFHPKFDWEHDSDLAKKVGLIGKEYRKINKTNNNYSKSTGIPYAVFMGEVACGGVNASQYETYENLLNLVIEGWYKSSGHRVIVFTKESANEGETSFIGVSIKLDSNGNFYAVANLIIL
jgi:uncharacterized protein YkwD